MSHSQSLFHSCSLCTRPTGVAFIEQNACNQRPQLSFPSFCSRCFVSGVNTPCLPNKSSLTASQLTTLIGLMVQAINGLMEHTNALPATPILPARQALTMIMSLLARGQEVVHWPQDLQLPATRFYSLTLVMTKRMPSFSRFLHCNCSLPSTKVRNGIISSTTIKT